jgi:hypothetical protein
MLTIQVKEDAPAHTAGFVKINATVGSFMGPFGRLVFINGFEYELDISFTPAYLPLISIGLPQTNIIEIPPFNATKIPINITNVGNARTKVFIEIDDFNKTSWGVTIPDSIILETGETKQVFLTVEADNDFDKETLRIKITPARAEDTSDSGNPEYVTILLENDGSYKEKTDEIDITLLIVILVVILAIIIIFMFIMRMRRQ